MSEDLDQMLLPGNTLRIDYGPGNHNNQLIHIRAWVDGAQIVFRWWSYKRRRWMYQIESRYYFEIRQANGYLTPVATHNAR